MGEGKANGGSFVD